MDRVPYVLTMLCYIQLAILIAFGHIRDRFGSLFGYSRYMSATLKPGFAKLLVAREIFYTNRIYHRVQDVFNRPIASAPGSHVDLIERYSEDENKTMRQKNGCIKRCVNLGSYNYLGFADDWLTTCSRSVFAAVRSHGIAATTPPAEFGTTDVVEALEIALAQFIGKEAAIVYNMGYATNSTTIPALMGKGTLIISDNYNHSSIVNGARASQANIYVFRHNDARHLEHILRTSIANGQPRTHRPWKKILVIVEGIYSMEGEISNLRDIVDVVKKYKAYIYVDEAHSIGALGKTGRGICEYTGVDPSEIDILMGTFTKSFGGMGGYIAASKSIVSIIRSRSAGLAYAASLSPIVAQQVLTALTIISDADGTMRGKARLDALRENSNYFRKGLINMGLLTLGDYDSPVIPVMLYCISKIAEFSRECLKRNLAVVTVGFPATPLLLARVRFCVSAGHTKEDLDYALAQIKEVSKICRISFLKKSLG